MIKDHQRELNRLQVVLDAIIIIAAYGTSWLLMQMGLVPSRGDTLEA